MYNQICIEKHNGGGGGSPVHLDPVFKSNQKIEANIFKKL